MEFKGTKGEWRMMKGGFTRKGNNPNHIRIYATNDNLEMICSVDKDQLLVHQTQDGVRMLDQNFEANAKLIAAAPDLLEALQDFLSDYKNDSISMGTVGNAEQAINKALK